MALIFHIDLNAFFASCEEIRDPSLKNKPVVIGGKSRRSIVSTANYNARKYGIHSAMPMYQAIEACKDLVIIEGNMSYYKEMSNQFFKIIEKYTDKIEVASIDECYCDMSDAVAFYHNAIELAKTLQQDVLNSTGLGCSIGISNNKFLAKMASDLKKPLGITLLNANNIPYFLWPLDVEQMHGIGKKTAAKLRAHNILTIRDIADEKNLEILKGIIGKYAYRTYQKANGKDYNRIELEREDSKSIGNSTTLERDTMDEEVIKETLRYLAKNVASRAKKKKMVSEHIVVTIKYTRVDSQSKNVHIEEATNDEDKIYQAALRCFESFYDDRPVRLLGVSLNSVILESEYYRQLSLFNYQDELPKKNESLELAKKFNLDVASSLMNKS